MMWLRRYAPVFAIPAVVVVLAFGSSYCPSTQSSSLVGESASEIHLAVEAGPGAGEGVVFELEPDRLTVLDFWASWCPPCRESTPILNRLAAQRPHVRFVGVNVETLTVAQLRSAYASFGYRFPTVVDRSGALAGAFRVASLPTLVVVDGAGLVVHVERGVPDEDGLGRLLDGLVH